MRDAGTAQYTIDAFFLQKEVGELLDEKQDNLTALNAMSSAIAKLDEKGQNKLEAVIVFADPKNAAQICQLAKTWICSASFQASIPRRNTGST